MQQEWIEWCSVTSRMMRSRARVLLSLILNQMNGECLIKSILIPVVYDALLVQQCWVDERRFTLTLQRFSRVWNEVRNIHAWFSSRPSAPSVRHWMEEFILIRSLRKVLLYFQMLLTAIIKLTRCMMGPSIVSLLWRNLVWHRMRPSTKKRPYSNLIKLSSSKLWYMRLTITKRKSIGLSLDVVIYQMVPKLSWLSGVLSESVILMAPWISIKRSMCTWWYANLGSELLGNICSSCQLG